MSHSPDTVHGKERGLQRVWPHIKAGANVAIHAVASAVDSLLRAVEYDTFLASIVTTEVVPESLTLTQPLLLNHHSGHAVSVSSTPFLSQDLRLRVLFATGKFKAFIRFASLFSSIDSNAGPIAGTRSKGGTWVYCQKKYRLVVH